MDQSRECFWLGCAGINIRRCRHHHHCSCTDAGASQAAGAVGLWTLVDFAGANGASGGSGKQLEYMELCAAMGPLGRPRFLRGENGEPGMASPGESRVSLPIVNPGSVLPPASDDALRQKDRGVLQVRENDLKSGSVLQKAWHITSGIWLAGTLSLVIGIAVINLRLWHSMRKLRLVTEQRLLDLLEDCKQQMRVRTVVGLVMTDRVKKPVVVWIYLSAGVIARRLYRHVRYEELRYIFLHELAHLKRGDIWIGWIVALMQSLHWFNPLVWWAFVRMRADRELACDSLVLSHVQGEEIGCYGGAH